MKKSTALLALAFTSLIATAHAEDLTKRGIFTPNQGYYIRGGGDYVRVGASGSNSATNFGGGSFAGGLNFAESDIGYHQLEIQAGVLGSRTDHMAGSTVVAKETDTAVPVLLNYNYNFKLTDVVHPYVGASLGLTYIKQEMEGAAFPLGSAKIDGTTFTFGAGLGVYFRCTDHFGIDVGYRYLRLNSYTADASYGGSSGKVDVDAANAHNVRIAAVWRF